MEWILTSRPVLVNPAASGGMKYAEMRLLTSRTIVIRNLKSLAIYRRRGGHETAATLCFGLDRGGKAKGDRDVDITRTASWI